MIEKISPRAGLEPETARSVLWPALNPLSYWGPIEELEKPA